MNLKQQYNSIGKAYITASKEQSSIKEKASKDFILHNLHFTNKIVLDLGCGNGKDIPSFKAKGAKEVYGIDSSKLMIAEAKRLVKPPARFFIADILKLPFDDASFDIIIAKHSLNYIADLNAAWQEISRVLKHNGQLIFTVPSPFSEIFLKKNRDYSTKEIINLKAYNKVALKFPSHTLANYLSPRFLKLFSLQKVWEFSKQEEWIQPCVSPVILGILATKKA